MPPRAHIILTSRVAGSDALEVVWRIPCKQTIQSKASIKFPRIPPWVQRENKAMKLLGCVAFLTGSGGGRSLAECPVEDLRVQIQSTEEERWLL